MIRIDLGGSCSELRYSRKGCLVNSRIAVNCRADMDAPDMSRLLVNKAMVPKAGTHGKYVSCVVELLESKIGEILVVCSHSRKYYTANSSTKSDLYAQTNVALPY